RGRGFNYKDRYKIWHIDNVSGLEKRASRLLGIENRPSNWLSFGSGLSILATGFEFQDTNVTLKSVDTFNSYKEVYSAVENMILSGVFLSNYETESGGQIRVKCNGKYIAESERTDYSDEESKQGINTLITSFRDELLKNQRSNRKNLAININEYIVKPALNDIELTTEGTYPKFMFSFIIAIDDHEIIKGDFEGCISELSMDEGLNEDELKLMALEHVFWTTLFYARDENNYRLVENSGDYVYEILDRCKNVVGTSVDKDFSQDLAMSLSDAEIKIADSISNDGQYSVLGNPTATKSNIEVTIDGSLDEGDITGVMEVEHTVPINYIEDDVIYLAEYRPFINEDFNISISTNDQNVNKKVNKTGTGVDCNTQLFMESSLQTEYPPDGTNSIGTIKYNESFPIVGIEGNKITARTKEGLRSIRKNVCLVNNHFFGNEGLHLIEHILLRPKIYHPYLPFKKEGIDNDKLDLIVNPKGDIYFQKQVKILELDQNQNMIIVSGDLTSELGTAFDSENQIQIERSSGYNGVYKLREVTFANNQTLIKVIGQLPRVQHIIREFGVISYYKQALGVSFLDDGQKIEIEDPDFEPKTEKVELRIRDSLNNVNDGDFIATVEKNDTKWRAKLMEKRSEIEDRLLPVSKSDCHACTIEDPYSFMATVVVPYWQGRFDTPGFREFVEKTIRTEAPAHIHLNICWIDNRQMIMFEKAYKEWLLELAKEESDPEELSAALNNFIGVIEQLRNVYPSGRLHNCEDGDQIRNSIILDNTSIGTL
ncbi:MAG: hypothetical protein OEW87_10565, partial [Flavobacteriaceae bacterium]|nr:hypothetical protein [Flavobacteriaceae bacterium]